MKLYNMIGYKLFKQNEDGSVHMLRIVDMHKPFKVIDQYIKEPSVITVYDYNIKKNVKLKVDSLKEYSPLKPDGVATFSVVNIRDEKGNICKDVLVTATKFLNIEYKLNIMPYAVCRQNITDIFYNLMSKNPDDTLVGLAINQDTCPANFDFGIMFAADSIVYSDFINFYRMDTIDDILSLINVKKYDEVLNDLFMRHIKYINKPQYQFKNEHGGWCKNLETLIKENNFMADINQMLGIIEVDFDIDNFSEEVTNNDITYNIAREDLRYWLSSICKANIVEATILKFDHDINLGDFNDTKYLLIRDNKSVLYLVAYRTEGEYYEADLDKKFNEMDFSTKFKLAFMDSKYNNIK